MHGEAPAGNRCRGRQGSSSSGEDSSSISGGGVREASGSREELRVREACAIGGASGSQGRGPQGPEKMVGAEAHWRSRLGGLSFGVALKWDGLGDWRQN